MSKTHSVWRRVLGITTALLFSVGLLVATTLPAHALGNKPVKDWKVAALQGVTWVSDLHPSGTITFQDGKVHGNDSCNIFNGEYQVENGFLTFGPMLQTMMYCSENHHVQHAFRIVFASTNKFTVRYHLNGTKRLVLAPIDVKGAPPMTFTAKLKAPHHKE